MMTKFCSYVRVACSLGFLVLAILFFFCIGFLVGVSANYNGISWQHNEHAQE